MMRNFCAFAILTIALSSCSNRQSEIKIAPSAKSDNTSGNKKLPEEMSELADSIVAWFHVQDYRSISRAISYEKGIRFSPYSYVNQETDFTTWDEHFSSVHMLDDRYWGNYDGSGDSIIMNLPDYASKFIIDADYLKKGQKLVNLTKGTGNMPDNMKAIYPESEFVEYYIPGTEEYSGMDWKSLRLVFEKENGEWKLVGIIHGQWTI